MRVIGTFVSMLVMLLVLQASAQAWSMTEHQIIARIAWERMTPQARANAVALLLTAPADSGIRDRRFEDGSAHTTLSLI